VACYANRRWRTRTAYARGAREGGARACLLRRVKRSTCVLQTYRNGLFARRRAAHARRGGRMAGGNTPAFCPTLYLLPPMPWAGGHAAGHHPTPHTPSVPLPLLPSCTHTMPGMGAWMSVDLSGMFHLSHSLIAAFLFSISDNRQGWFSPLHQAMDNMKKGLCRDLDTTPAGNLLTCCWQGRQLQRFTTTTQHCRRHLAAWRGTGLPLRGTTSGAFPAPARRSGGARPLLLLTPPPRRPATPHCFIRAHSRWLGQGLLTLLTLVIPYWAPAAGWVSCPPVIFIWTCGLGKLAMDTRVPVEPSPLFSSQILLFSLCNSCSVASGLNGAGAGA